MEVDPRTWMIHEVTLIVTGTQIIVTIVATTKIIIVPSINIIIVASIKIISVDSIKIMIIVASIKMMIKSR